MDPPFGVVLTSHWQAAAAAASLSLVVCVGECRAATLTVTVYFQVQGPRAGPRRPSPSVCWWFIFKDTEPSGPLQDSFSVRQQGGLPGSPARIQVVTVCVESRCLF